MPDEEEEQTSSRPFWSGTITFGLVSVPVSLFPANRSSGVPMRMLGPDGTPLSRRYYSPETGRDLSPEEIVRGYEIEKDRYVVVTDEELERLAPEKSRDIDLRRFVDVNAIPPAYFERAYFLVPAGPSTKAYRLLAQTMEETERAGIATFVMRGKEYLVAILSENGILRAETLRFHDEIRSPEDVGLPEKKKVPDTAVRHFQKAIQKLSADDVSKNELKNESSERLMRLAEKKRKRGEDVIEAEAPEERAEVVDIMTVLQRSLKQARAQSRQGTEPDDLENRSRSELYERAKALNIAGRSSMSKEELIGAIRQAA